MDALKRSIRDMMLNAQTSSASHPRLIKSMINLYLKSDFKEFLEAFKYILKFPLIHGEKQPIVERTLSFTAKFATSVKSEKEPKSGDESLFEGEDVEELDPFLIAIFNFLLENHEANSRGVRYRVCFLINKLLNSMGDQASIDDELYSTIYDTMLQRLMDKIPEIRVQAILAIARLQDPRNKDCPVIKAYRFHLAMDPNPEVRKAIINNIAITFQTLPDVLDRIRDVKETVRRQAYVVLSRKVHIRSFTIAQRVMLISEGLNDRSAIVRESVKKNLLQAWIRLVDGDVLEFLTKIDVEASTSSAELALSNMFENVPYDTLMENFNLANEEKVLDINKLTPESSLYWKCLAKHFKKEGADQYLEQILPDLTRFCEYVEQLVRMDVPEEKDPQETALKCMEKEFILQQLLSIASIFDLSDEVGRQRLNTTLHQFFLNMDVGESCMNDLCAVFEVMHGPEKRINHLAEIIAELREPVCETPIPMSVEKPQRSEHEETRHKLKMAKIRVQINEVREQLEKCVRSLNLDIAQDIKSQLKNLEEEYATLSVEMLTTPLSVYQQTKPSEHIDENEDVKLLDDPALLGRCLLILSKVLASPDVNILTVTLRSLHDNLVLTCLQSQVPEVRKLAIQSLAMLCLISEELAKQHFLLFVQISKMDIEEIQLVALKAVFDFLLLYGVEPFESSNDDGDADKMEKDTDKTVVQSSIAELAKLLNSDNGEKRTIVAEGLSKLLLSSRLTSSKLFSELVILWYNPTSEADNMLRHMLGVFFPLYASRGGESQEVISRSFIPTIKALADPPKRSPLVDVDLEDVASFLVSITSPAIVADDVKNAPNCHDILVFRLCAEIMACPDNFYTRVLLRSLNHLSITPTNLTTLKQIDALCNKMRKGLVEKTLLNSVDKFQLSINNHIKVIPVPEITPEKAAREHEVTATMVSDEPEDATTVKRKRMLYNTQTELEHLSDTDSKDETAIAVPKRPRSETNSPSMFGTSDEDEARLSHTQNKDTEKESSAEESFQLNSISNSDEDLSDVENGEENIVTEDSILEHLLPKKQRSRPVAQSIDAKERRNVRSASVSANSMQKAPQKKKARHLDETSDSTSSTVSTRSRRGHKNEDSSSDTGRSKQTRSRQSLTKERTLKKKAGILASPRIMVNRLSTDELSSSQESSGRTTRASRKKK